MNNDSLLDFAPYLFLLKTDSTYSLSYWVSVPAGYKAETPTIHVHAATQTWETRIHIVASSQSPAEIIKVEQQVITDVGSLEQLKVVVEYPKGDVSEEKSTVLLFAMADTKPVVDSGSSEGILPYKPYGYLAKGDDGGDDRLYYLLYTPVTRGLEEPSLLPSAGDKLYLGYILDVQQGNDGEIYSGSTDVPRINLNGESYTYLDTYVATLEESDSETEHLGQPSTTGSTIFLYEDAD